MRSPLGDTAGWLPSAILRGAPPRDWNDPNILLDALREAGGIWIVAKRFEIAAADEDDGAAVRGPSDLGDLLAVVIVVIGKRRPL